MQRTGNFNLIVVEGSDTVNLLTQMNPNTEAIDEQMFKNQNAGVQTATELLSGTVHAITRSVPDASMIRFTAVSRFTAGDTFTVDGVQVSALLPSGEQLSDGAFIIGSEVLCVLKGTLLTVFASGGTVALAKNAEKLGGEFPSYYATKTEVDTAQNTANSAGNLAETNRQDILTLSNKMNNCIKFADFSNVLHTITTRAASWTATEDCLMLGSIGGGSTSNGCVVYVDNIVVFSSTLENNITLNFYIKKGQTVTTKDKYGRYNLSFYKLM